jgi:hypothetical protein
MAHTIAPTALAALGSSSATRASRARTSRTWSPQGTGCAWSARPPRRGASHGSIGWIRQWIESVNDTLKGQLDLERHGGRTPEGIYTRIAQRLLAMAMCIWHNWASGQHVKRSLTAYDN